VEVVDLRIVGDAGAEREVDECLLDVQAEQQRAEGIPLTNFVGRVEVLAIASLQEERWGGGVCKVGEPPYGSQLGGVVQLLEEAHSINAVEGVGDVHLKASEVVGVVHQAVL
jgi:hypothetical protein